MPFDDRIRLATSLGLSLYEARAYVALLERGEARANEIATAARVPRGRIYEVLDSLHEKGFLSVVPMRPLRYRPVALEAFADRRRRELRRAERELEDTASRLMSEVSPRPAPGPTGDFLLFRKRRAVYRKAREMIEGARTELLVSSSEMCIVRGHQLLLDAYRAAAKAGVRVRIVVKISGPNRAAADAYRRYVELRHSELGNRGTSILVVDRREVLLCHWNPDDADPFVGDDVGLWSTNPGIVQSFHDIVEDAWKNGMASEARFVGPEAVRPPSVPEIAGGAS